MPQRWSPNSGASWAPLRTLPRKFDGGRLVIASHNPGKVVEIADLLAAYAAEFVSAAALGLPEPEETGTTFSENAALKARAAAVASGEAALADDSGLVVPDLEGAPGIYSARWAGPGKDFAVAMRRVHDRLAEEGIVEPSAWFECALALGWPDGHVECVDGRVTGHLVWPPRGDTGFGYDPIFVPDQERGAGERTFGEMEPHEKHAISHRARAFAKLVQGCLAP